MPIDVFLSVGRTFNGQQHAFVASVAALLARNGLSALTVATADAREDPLRLVMPPAVSVPLAVLFVAAFVAIFGTPVAWAIGAGFLAGYLVYDMLHYALHHHRQPRTALERRLRELHMRHHFEDETHGYGISAPWWDIVFGTFGQRRKRA